MRKNKNKLNRITIGGEEFLVASPHAVLSVLAGQVENKILRDHSRGWNQKPFRILNTYQEYKQYLKRYEIKSPSEKGL